MNSHKTKILIGSFLVLLLLFFSIFYFASTKLRPEEIKKVAIAHAKTIFPNAELTLGTVSIGWGFNFNVHLENLKLKALKDNNAIDMMVVDQLVVRVPIWAILTGRGVIEIKVDAPTINYIEFLEGNNWTYALGNKKTTETGKNPINSTVSNATESSSIASIGFLGKSKINVKLTDIAVKYALRDNSNGEIKVSRFLVKGLNFESATAFEVASTANFIMKDQSKFSFDTLVIGQINISDLVKNGSVSSLVIVKINNIAKTGLAIKVPEITSNFDVILKKDGEVSGKILTTFESQNKISANFKMSKEIEISDINIDIIMRDIGTILGLEKTADMSKAKLLSKGNITYGADKKLNANLNFAITPGFSISQDGINSTTTVEGTFKNRELAIKTKTEILEGIIETSTAGIFDPNEKFDIAKLKVFDIKVNAKGMKVPEKMIRERLWAKKAIEEKPIKENNEETTTSVPKTENQTAMGLPPSNISLDWNNILVGNEDFSGHGRIVTSLKAIAIDGLVFKFSKGSGKLSQTMNIGSKANESKFNFEINNLNLAAFKAFLPPFVENFTGVFTGKIGGSATIFKDSKLPSYDISVIADAKNGEIKKLNLSDYVTPLMENIPMVKDQLKGKEVKYDGNFESFVLKGHFTNTLYSIPSFDFIGLDKKVQVTGSGEIYPRAGNKMSAMEVMLTDNTGKISDLLLKNTGSKILPMRLTGPGFDLKPDYGFTIGRLAKGAIKTKGEEKVKEALLKNIDKYVPAASKEKVQGLLNGLFKNK